MEETEIKTYKLDYKESFYVVARVWIVFILVFVFVGISPVLCVVLGLLAGLATRQIVAYWRAEEVKVKLEEAASKPPEKQEIFRPVVGRLLERLRPATRGDRSLLARRRPRRIGK
jgi:hypothetical protein